MSAGDLGRVSERRPFPSPTPFDDREAVLCQALRDARDRELALSQRIVDLTSLVDEPDVFAVENVEHVVGELPYVTAMLSAAGIQIQITFDARYKSNPQELAGRMTTLAWTLADRLAQSEA